MRNRNGLYFFCKNNVKHGAFQSVGYHLIAASCCDLYRIAILNYIKTVVKVVAPPAISYANNIVVYKQGGGITPTKSTNTQGAVPNIAYGTTTTITNGGYGYANGNGSVAKFAFSGSFPTIMVSDRTELQSVLLRFGA
ncbi:MULTISPECIES: hypothetical protein [unclassified Mucilaginibacter]|uniref:hypothetical protein n=1 Tax=unclassified Mucilaginibacter TaxID=2617802 RepID=UPI002B22CE1D|nr:MULTISPECIES: hypothetical protein [unclassified Mucilaginibacter]MEB0262929.1 hypothetical protein [Mucilaginibacter sp. 10I4]MEB0278222.1 hypothetical protein [Mucilaginibacter sp. 10B2]MEB0300992.1 hypothetical protein [Mucilaginibacter sp. 5C4]